MCSIYNYNLYNNAIYLVVSCGASITFLTDLFCNVASWAQTVWTSQVQYMFNKSIVIEPQTPNSSH